MESRAFKNMLVAGAAALLATCSGANPPSGAQAAAASGGQCFNAATVNSFDAIDDDTVLVTVGVRNVYRLEIVGVCPDVDWSLRVGLRSAVEVPGCAKQWTRSCSCQVQQGFSVAR